MQRRHLSFDSYVIRMYEEKIIDVASKHCAEGFQTFCKSMLHK